MQQIKAFNTTSAFFQDRPTETEQNLKGDDNPIINQRAFWYSQQHFPQEHVQKLLKVKTGRSVHKL